MAHKGWLFGFANVSGWRTRSTDADDISVTTRFHARFPSFPL